MSAGLSRLLGRRTGGTALRSAASRTAGPDLQLRSALVGLVVLATMVLGTAAWLTVSADDGESVDGSLLRLTPETMAGMPVGDEDGMGLSRAIVGSSSPTPGGSLMEANASIAPATQQRIQAAASDPVILSGLRISSQSWQRGGLGSKALVTFTVRNANQFAVRDVEISCAFSRRDGSHVTDRRRLVSGEVRSRSRKTFAAVHVGFVNVNASTAKCALVAAAKI
ncbi:hypothetical protein LQG66_08815 [Bradyrhizobium ontarionense]|uniref:Uncharacterized protein n=1 Tax=Bradyrhizobium ontarionense TaxID=2898149 RepID=A0ABY3RI14_9BRAD|nr:hypothetical protein [Bradyrhizobium sp. A19]UFZ06378.1 hypothetical protein LQG66_08815 [Bradyrhizobium sp. A19]